MQIYAVDSSVSQIKQGKVRCCLSLSQIKQAKARSCLSLSQIKQAKERRCLSLIKVRSCFESIIYKTGKISCLSNKKSKSKSLFIKSIIDKTGKSNCLKSVIDKTGKSQWSFKIQCKSMMSYHPDIVILRYKPIEHAVMSSSKLIQLRQMNENNRFHQHIPPSYKAMQNQQVQRSSTNIL